MTTMPPNLQLCPPSLADAETLLAFELAHRAYFEHWINARPADYYHLEAVRAAIADAERDRQADRGYQFLIKRDEAIIGRINLTSVTRPYYNKATLGYRIGEGHTGQGVASHALSELKRIAFGELGLHRLEAVVRPENVGSVRVLERNGFHQFGHATRCMQLHGEWFDLLYFELHAPQAALDTTA